MSIENYRNKISGPMLDRIDMQIKLPRVDFKTLQSSSLSVESSKIVRHRVCAALEVQLARQGKQNAMLNTKEIESVCQLNREMLEFLEKVCERLNMSARAYHRILKLARTIADMESESDIQQQHLAEAVTFRRMDRA